VLPSITGYMLTPSILPFVKSGVCCINSYKMMGNFLDVLNFNRLFSQTQPVDL
jgi:hypothetical protein